MFVGDQCFNVIFTGRGYIDLAYKIMTYLDMETIQCVLEDEDAQQKMMNSNLQKQIKTTNQSHMRDLLRSWYLMKQYINKTDRTMYYSFYQEEQFIDNEKSLIQSIIINQALHQNQKETLGFANYYGEIHQLLKQIQSQLLNSQQTQELKRIITDPMLPLPSIKREHQGMFCNSSFQIYLVGLRFPHYGEGDAFSLFQQFALKLQDEQQHSFKTFFQIKKNKHNNKKQYQNLHLVRYLPYQITFNNYHQLLIENVSLHNLIVYLFALTDIWLNATYVYIKSINDPFYKFIELMTRYAIFRSTIIEIQEAFSSFFRRYESLYTDTIKDSIFQSSSIKPKFCFWRPALTKWFSKMHEMHKQTNEVYFLLLTQKREERLLQLIQEPIQEHINWPIIKSLEMSLKNHLQISSMTTSIKQNLYSPNASQTIIESFVANNEFISESLVFQYIEYMIDLSINQETVHWCGHSQHKLSRPFNEFMSCFMNYNANFYNHLDTDLLSDVVPKDIHSEIYSFLVQVDFKLLQQKNLKSVILRQIIQQINSCQPSMIKKINKQKLNKSQKILHELSVKDSIETNDSVSQKEIPIHKPIIFYDFTEKDEKLRYFNEKAKICESIEGQQKYFFQIPPQLSPQQILSKSISTNDASENQQNDDEGYQYMSNGQDSSCNDIDQIEIQSKEQQKIEPLKKSSSMCQMNEIQGNNLSQTIKQNGNSKQTQQKMEIEKSSGEQNQNNFFFKTNFL